MALTRVPIVMISPGQMVVDTFTGDGTTTVFTLSADPVSKNNTWVEIDGVYQAKSQYSYNSATLQITFTVAPPSGSGIEVVSGLASPIASITDGTVTLAKLSAAGGAANRKVAINSANTGFEFRSMVPTRQVLASGSGTYTTPAGCVAIEVEMVGGGGGGACGDTGYNLGHTGGNGTATTFGTLSAGAGAGGAQGAVPATGGGSSGGDINITGGDGQGNIQESTAVAGTNGAAGPWGGAGAGGGEGQPGTAGKANSGSGGGGGGKSSGIGGIGGAAGGYCRKLISAPAATYSYAVGSGGTAGTGGTGQAGGAGGSGLIIVTEYY